MGHLIVLGIGLMTGCDVSDTTRGVTASVVGTTVEATKGLAEGVQDGFQAGRQGASSAAGSFVLATRKEVAAATMLAVHDVRPAGDRTEVVLAIENRTPQSIHLIGLDEDGGALLIDADGFAHMRSKRSKVGVGLGSAIEVPGHAKVKATIQFDGTPASPATVRVWGQQLPVSVPVDVP